MDPITVLLIAGVAESIFSTVEIYSKDAWRADLTGQQNKEIEKLRHEFQVQQLELQQRSAGLAAAERFRQELRLAELRHELRLREIVFESNLMRKEQIDAAEWECILNHWPLRLYKSQLNTEIPIDRKYPIKLLISPAVTYNGANSEHPLARIGNEVEERLGTFLRRYYGRSDSQRPVEFLGGAWDAETMRRETAVKAIFSLLKSEPTMIIDSEVIGDYLYMRLGYWGLGASNFLYEPSVMKLHLTETLDHIARERAREWRVNREVLRQGGASEAELEEKGGRRARNLKILEQEERLAALRLGRETIDVGEFEHGADDWQSISEMIQVFHCIITAMVADVHHFAYYGTTPILPEALKTLLQDSTHRQMTAFVADIVEQVEGGYANLLSKVKQDSSVLYPSLILKLTESFAALSNQLPARRLLAVSMESWLSQHGVTLGPTEDAFLKIARMRSPEDEEYFGALTKLDKRLSLVERKDAQRPIATSGEIQGMDIGEQLSFARQSLAELTRRIRDLIQIDSERFAKPKERARVEKVLGALETAHIDLSQPVFRIVTLAITSAGKSTVANALAGHCIAPMSQEELSAGILTIRHSEVLRLHIEQPELTNDSSPFPWKAGEWIFPTATHANVQEIYNLVRDGVMKPYQEAKNSGPVPIPRVSIEIPLLPVQNRRLLNIPDGVEFEIVDLPGLNTEQDSTNLKVIQDNAERGFCLMIIDYGETNPSRRDQLLQKLKKHVNGLKGRTDSIIFVLNKFDLRTSADTESEVSRRIDRLKDQIQKQLALKQAPDIIPLNGLMWMKGQVVWGTSSSLDVPSTDPELRKYLLDGSDDKEVQGFGVDCAQDIARIKRLDPEFRRWFADHESDLGNLDNEGLRYLHETAVRFSGGAAMWECLRVRFRERFGAIVIWPAVYTAVRETTRFLAIVRRMARLGQYSSRDDILAAIDQIRCQTEAIRNGVRKEQERFRRIQDALMTAIQVNEGEGAHEAYVALREENVALLRLSDVIRRLKQDLVTDVLTPIKDGLEGDGFIEVGSEGIPKYLGAKLVQSLASFVCALESFDRGVAVEVRRASATERRSLGNLWGLMHRHEATEAELKRKGDDFYIEAKSDDDAANRKMRAAEAAYREFGSVVLETMEHRLLFGLQVEAKSVEEQLTNLLGELFQSLRSLALAETGDQELVDTVFNGQEPNPNADSLKLPTDIFSYEAEAYKERVRRTKVETYLVEERIWYKPWRKHTVTKDRVATVEYDAMIVPGPLRITQQLEQSYDAKVEAITNAISQWIETTLLGYSDELEKSAALAGKELEVRLEVRLTEDVETWVSDNAYWNRFQNELPRCFIPHAELRVFQES